jgi:FtsP/CotA-like multicopper oxidase with cupredoxin domain
MSIVKSIRLATALAAISSTASAANIQEPPVFASSKGVLDLLMVAQPTPITGFTSPGFAPQGWAYQVCARPKAGNACPPGTPTPYGGVRLWLQPGDTLKIRLVNQLPPMDPANVDRSVDDPLLPLNPTNLHTHGLIVDATPNTAIPPAVPVYGDFVFTSVFNPANGNPDLVNPAAAKTVHAHGDVVSGGVVDYVIPIPGNHPSGAFWFHPHVHGISVNQLSAGLSGIITVGNLSAYACGDNGCKLRLPDTMHRHLILKDMQVLPDPAGGIPQLQTDPAFCLPTPAAGDPARNGACDSDPSVVSGG